MRAQHTQDNSQMPGIVALMEKDLSEPYTLYTYRYFIFSWPHLCILAHCNDELVGVIVCKEEVDQRKRYMRGYIAMLAVADAARRRGIGELRGCPLPRAPLAMLGIAHRSLHDVTRGRRVRVL